MAVIDVTVDNFKEEVLESDNKSIEEEVDTKIKIKNYLLKRK